MCVIMEVCHLKGMELRAPYKHIFCPYTPLTAWVGGKGKKKSFLNDIKLKGNIEALTLYTHLWVGLKG